MISACDTQDFAPFGREYMRHHPGEFQIQVQNVNHADCGIPLLKSFREFSLQDATSGKKEKWIFRGAGGVNVTEEHSRVEAWKDEELYISGQTVVWSRTGQDGVQSIIKTFTMDSPVLQCLWTTFILTGSPPSPNDTVTPGSGDVSQNGVCIVESNTLTCFLEKGGEYSTVLPFQVSQTWKIKNGLLFERALTASELSTPKKSSPNCTIVFSMFHPLDDVCPVITKTTGAGGTPRVNYMTDGAQHILFTSEKPSLAFIYDTMMGLHSAWHIRRARPEECSSLSYNLESTSLLHLTPVTGLSQSTSACRVANLSGTVHPPYSPMRSISERLFSPVSSFVRPSPSLPHFGNSRSLSPAVIQAEAALYRFNSPSPQVRSNSAYKRTPSCSYNASFTGNDSCMDVPVAPQPEVCLEHLWTESAPTIRDGPLGKASKVFMSSDLCGQRYICYVVPYKQQLRCIKFEESNDLSQLIFGSVTIIPAKDACPVESLDLLLILEINDFVTVYTGVTKISTLHIPLLPTWSGSLSLRNTGVGSPQTSPTRGQVFTSSRPPSAMDARFDEEMTHISPVPLQLEGTPSQLESSVGDNLSGNSFIQGLRDNVRNKVYVELMNGSLYRTSLPSICTSPGISLCLKALRHLLPRDVALQFLGRWYTLRNTPGGIGQQSEWHVFQRCLLSHMGYDTLRLALTGKREHDRSMSPVMSAKRAKPSDQGTDEDWEFLLSSSHHNMVMLEVESALGLEPIHLVPDRTWYSKPCTVNTTALLFPHCPAILLALHLSYEELKLNVLYSGELEALSPLLYQISRDLCCEAYSDLYCRDFPHLFDLYDDVSQMAQGELTKMQYPSVFPAQPPSIMGWLYNSLQGRPQLPFLFIPFVCSSIQTVVSVFDDIQADVDKQASVKMLQTGSCGLHVIHNAFRAGCVAANWDIEEFLTRLYILFQDCPARRQDFMEVTGQNKFPLKFCTHRWLENIQPAERTLELLPHLSTYCNAAMTKNVTEPRNASFQIVLKAIQDPLIAAKLHFFLVVARELYALMMHKDVSVEQSIERCLQRLAPAGHRAPTAELSLSRSFHTSPVVPNVAHCMLLTLTHLGMTQQDIDCLPVGVSLPLREAILHCRFNPQTDWSEQEYNLIDRQDLWRLLVGPASKPLSMKSTCAVKEVTSDGRDSGTKEEEDGMEHLDQELLSLRWSEDLRVREVRKMLQSALPVPIVLTQRPEVSDHDFIEEQERHLYSICLRTMALPVGRGMFTLSTYTPLTTETLPIPKLCLTGRAPPRNATVELSRVEVPTSMTNWPHFHNGVAAGLRIAHLSQVESAWIIYNRPKSSELTNEYAGFLMALGLNGHLPNLDTLNVHDYLSKGHEMTTIGILLGLAAAKRGRMDLATTKILSVHVPALLPPTSTELNIPHNVQVAAVMGVGLVFQGTGHSHMAEVLLAEIGRPPGPEMENCNDRESYSLSAGLALGLVMFGKGRQAMGLANYSMADILCHLMVGGQKRPLPGIYRERYKSPSYLIKEGDCVNVDVTSPGATLALGMLFFRTNNTAVAEWLQAPNTQFMLDHVRPDFLMLRTLSRGLVLWDDVVPSDQWIDSVIPQIVHKLAFKKGEESVQDVDDSIDFETMSQALVNILAGSSMVLGLKFAGTANGAAFEILLKNLRKMLDIVQTPQLCEQAGRSVMENCLSVVLISLAMVMAGTGNLEVLRVCRFLRKRVGQQYGGTMYGFHMAHALATGLLFLGGGKYTLCTTPDAVGVLLVAFFPKFPIFSTDNKYHLQAFRHLYVLAAQPRVLVPHDVDSGRVCFVPVQIKFKDCEYYTNQTFTTYAPCLLPELQMLEEVKVLGPRYWSITFQRDQNWDKLQTILQSGGVLSVKQRAGHLSYAEDPKGYRSQLGKSLTTDQSSHSCTKPDVIKSFTSDTRIVALAELFLGRANLDDKVVQQLSSLIYQCVVQEKADAICPHFVLQQLVQQSGCGGATQGLWQLKLCLAYQRCPFRLQPRPHRSSPTLPPPIIEPAFLRCLSGHVDEQLEAWQAANIPLLSCYMSGIAVKGQEVGCLSQYLAWFDIPTPQTMAHISQESELSLPILFHHLPEVDVSSLMRIYSVWKASVHADPS